MKKREIRRDILNTSARLFYKQGYRNTGINEIIEEAGIAKTTLYEYFRSKEDLMLVYIEEYGMETIQAMIRAIENADTPKGKMIGVFEYLEDQFRQNQCYGCSFLSMVYEIPDEPAEIKRKIKFQKDIIRGLFTEILRPINKENIADEIYTLLEGAIIANKVHDDIWPISAAKNSIKKLL